MQPIVYLNGVRINSTVPEPKPCPQNDGKECRAALQKALEAMKKLADTDVARSKKLSEASVAYYERVAEMGAFAGETREQSTEALCETIARIANHRVVRSRPNSPNGI